MSDKRAMNSNDISKALKYWKRFDKEIDVLIKRYPEQREELLKQREIVRNTLEVLNFALNLMEYTE